MSTGDDDTISDKCFCGAWIRFFKLDSVYKGAVENGCAYVLAV